METELHDYPCHRAVTHADRGARAVVDRIPLPPAAAEELRRRARLRSTHYSTRIEGNRLTLQEAEQAIAGQAIEAAGRERDVREVQNYWNALLRIEEWVARSRPLSENLIQRLHALVENGPKAKPTPYRDGQNVIRDSGSGRIVYLAPMAQDVPMLMAALVDWCEQAEKQELPMDVRARRVLSLCAKAEVITAVDVAHLFGFSDRAARHLLQELVADGVLAVTNTSNRARAYELSEVYRKLVGSLSEAESH